MWLLFVRFVCFFVCLLVCFSVVLRRGGRSGGYSLFGAFETVFVFGCRCLLE